MQIRIILLCLLLCSCQQNNLLLGAKSYHTNNRNLNETNELIGYEGTNKYKKDWRIGITSSYFNNSFNKRSVYAGGVLKNCFSRFCAGITAGGATGYDNYGSPVIPFAGFTADATIWKRFGLWSMVVPYTPEGTVGIVGFKYSW